MDVVERSKGDGRTDELTSSIYYILIIIIISYYSSSSSGAMGGKVWGLRLNALFTLYLFFRVCSQLSRPRKLFESSESNKTFKFMFIRVPEERSSMRRRRCVGVCYYYYYYYSYFYPNQLTTTCSYLTKVSGGISRYLSGI